LTGLRGGQRGVSLLARLRQADGEGVAGEGADAQLGHLMLRVGEVNPAVVELEGELAK
jgi:hypothetical protein